jgi:hypothetical protein
MSKKNLSTDIEQSRPLKWDSTSVGLSVYLTILLIIYFMAYQNS